MIKWNKNDKFTPTSPSEWFSLHEFECKGCTCNDQLIDSELVIKLDRIREKIGVPIIITSGYRCEKKQGSLREQGKETAIGVSQHELGKAIDLTVKDKNLMPELLELCKQEFKAIGKSALFIHVDLRIDKERFWSYRV